jgi:hypothetical protein
MSWPEGGSLHTNAEGTAGGAEAPLTPTVIASTPAPRRIGITDPEHKGE